MATRTTSVGTCLLCKRPFGRGAMSRHLARCRPAHEETGTDVEPARLLLLTVQGKDNPAYWMHLEVPASATLDQLDAFLRETWLECCDHLSAFTLGGGRPYGREELEMSCRLGDVLEKGAEFTHQYDFGSTTILMGRVIGERDGLARLKRPVVLLARNDPPVVLCDTCGEPATKVIRGPTGWLCDRCAEAREEDADLLLPVVNSPRVGVCGYTG
jgi:hypothetical protein